MNLPIFPLNLVLFPGATIPLHIFEPRYKEMVRSCLEENSPFGIILIREGSETGAPAKPFSVGTVAHITRKRFLEDGRMNLLCLGGQRFRLLKTVSEEPYLVGEVEMLTSGAAGDAKAVDLAETASALFAEYFRLQLALSNQWERSLNLPSAPDDLSDFIGCRLDIDLRAKQQVLEEDSIPRRLESEIESLSDAVREMTARVEAVRASRWRTLGSVN